MNTLDIGIIVVVLLFTLRGFWRGFLREGFALAGLIAGVTGAILGSEGVAAALRDRIDLPAPACAAIAFLGIFLVLHTTLNLVGILLDRATRSFFLGTLNRTFGGLFAATKSVVVVAFALLFLQLFPILPGFDREIAASSVGRPLVSAASTLVRAGLRVAEGPGGSRHA
jgi:membrane protein required for colicin V production